MLFNNGNIETAIGNKRAFTNQTPIKIFTNDAPTKKDSAITSCPGSAKGKKAEKKSSRIAAEGIVNYFENSKSILILELNSETDFVAKDENFISLSKSIAEILLLFPTNLFERENSDLSMHPLGAIPRCCKPNLPRSWKVELIPGLNILKWLLIFKS